jgi:malonyl CoA-acyl carrier protein transacylase
MPYSALRGWSHSDRNYEKTIFSVAALLVSQIIQHQEFAWRLMHGSARLDSQAAAAAIPLFN